MGGGTWTIPAFEDDPVAMALGLTPVKPGVVLPGTPEHCETCAAEARLVAYLIRAMWPVPS